MSAIDRDGTRSPAAQPERLLADAARAAQAAHDRLATALIDLFIHDSKRLSDQQRVTMTRLLEGLVGAVEDELRRLLIERLGSAASPELEAALGTARVEIAGPILERARMLRDPDLVAALLRRADEHRIVTALAFSADRDRPAEAGLFDRLVASGDAGIADGAMALLIAESRRFDRFHDPALARTDLPAELQHRLVWWVAAALRDYMTARHTLDPAIADAVIVASATAMLAGYDEGDTLEGRAFALAVRLNAVGRLDDALLAQALDEGHLSLFVACVALRAAIDGAVAWDMVIDPEGSRLAVLLRAIGCDRDAAAVMLLRLAFDADEGIAERVEDYDGLDPDDAREAIRPWRLDGAYRRAIASLAVSGQDGR